MVETNFKQTEIGPIPEDWHVKQFQDVLDGFSSGMTPYRAIKDYYTGKIPWITSGELNYNVITDTIEKITPQAVKDTSLRILPRGTFLMAITGLEAAGTRGSCAITGIEATTNQSCMSLFPKKGLIITEYLYHYYRSKGEELAFKYCQGTKQQSYTGAIAKKLPIIVPPTTEEQQAIATALSDADAWIESLEKLIAKKRLIKQGAMQELLTPKEDWDNVALKEVVWYQEGPGVRKHQFTQSGIKLLNGTNIEKGKLLLDKTNRFISEREANGTYEHFLVNDGDILIACSGISVEKFSEKVTISNFNHLPLCMNTSTMRFKITDKKIYKLFFYHFLKSNLFKDQIFGKATGSAQLNFGPAHIQAIDLIYPESLAEQTRIANILSDMDAEIDALEHKLQKAKQIKRGMMQQLLTGKIRLIKNTATQPKEIVTAS